MVCSLAWYLQTILYWIFLLFSISACFSVFTYWNQFKDVLLLVCVRGGRILLWEWLHFEWNVKINFIETEHWNTKPTISPWHLNRFALSLSLYVCSLFRSITCIRTSIRTYSWYNLPNGIIQVELQFWNLSTNSDGRNENDLYGNELLWNACLISIFQLFSIRFRYERQVQWISHNGELCAYFYPLMDYLHDCSLNYK